MVDREVPETEEVDDLRADLTAALRGEADEPKAEADPAEKPEAEIEVADHDAHDEGIAASVEKALEGEDKPAEQPEDEPAEAPVAPEHWSQEDKDFLAALPDDAVRARVQEWRKSIEKNADTKLQEAGDLRRSIEGVDEALKPLEPTLAQMGINKGEAVRRLVNAHQDLTQDLGRGLSGIAGQYGRQIAGTDQARSIVRQIAQTLGVEVGVQPVADAAATPANGVDKDPAQIAREAAQAVLDERDRMAREAQQNEAKSAAETTLRAFVEAKDEGGQPAHPHFEAVKTVMAGIMQAAAQARTPMTLEQAYSEAVWTRPDIREALTEAQRKEAARAADEARRSKVAAAKAAGTPTTSSAPGKTAEPPKEQSLRDDLRDALREQVAA